MKHINLNRYAQRVRSALCAFLFLIFVTPSYLYAPKAQECTLVSVGQDVQAILNKINIIAPQITNIQTVVNIILNYITNLSVNDQIIISKLDFITSLIENLNCSAIPCTVSGLDEIERQISIGDALILSKLDSLSISVPDTCCSVLENLISRDDALIVSKLDAISSQIDNINITVNVSALPCTISGFDEIIREISIGDALILSKLDTLSISVPDTCCSVLENLISRDDALIVSKLDTLSSQIDNINITVNVSALPCTISGFDEIIREISIGDALILSKIDSTNCCSALTSLISRDDALILSKLDRLTISVPDTCCSVLENLISRDDALIVSKLDTLSSQIDNINITVNVSALPCTISGFDEIIREISIGDALILSKLDTLSISVPDTCCSVLENLISRDDALIVSKLDNLSVQVSINDALILSVLDNQCCAPTPITTSTTLSVAGTYCLCNSVGTIDIFNTDIVVDLNGHVVTNGITIHSHNITIHNGTVRNPAGDAIQVIGGSNITISRVRTESALNNGINFLGVAGGLVEHCELVQNGTGISLNGTYEIEVYKTIARSSIHSGFSLISSFTNSIRDCQSLNSGRGNSTGMNNNVYGFVAQNSSSNIFENCIANATQALSTTDYNSIVAGFALMGASDCNKIIGCEAANAVTDPAGVTVPYGIYLQGSLGSTITLTGIPPIPVPGSGNVSAVTWSPDRKYLAVGMGVADAHRIRIYAFDDVNTVLYQIAVPDKRPGDVVNSLDWSPDGKYLVAGINQGVATDVYRVRVYAFDTANNSLTLVATPTPVPDAGINVLSVKWSPNGQYIALGSDAPNGTPQLAVYYFDRVSNALTLHSSAMPDQIVYGVDWSADGRYIAAGLGVNAQGVRVYSFVPSSSSLALVASANAPSSALVVFSVKWSPDCNYIAAGASQAGVAGFVGVYSFMPATSSSSASVALQQLATLSVAPVTSVDWSADGRYIVAGCLASPFVPVYRYDRGTNQLLLQAVPNINPSVSSPDFVAIDWSPDGQYIAAVTNGTGDPNRIYLYEALSFPVDNVIRNNTVYCNSGAECPNGVGICGPSICNYIVGNTAYSNPINPAMASSNYQFVCNVYNQLFELAPSQMQNIALGTCEPIGLQDNPALLIKQTKVQISSQIEDLSLQVSIDDALILSKLNFISSQVDNINITVNVSSLPCTISGFDEIIREISIGDALILSKLDNLSVSVPDTCCSVLENLISRDDALIVSKLDRLTSLVENLNISVVPCTVSGLDEIIREISLGDALILSRLDSLTVSVPDTCCSVLENLISRDDAYLATKIDNLSTLISVNDALILSALDNLSVSVPDSCCSVLENLISRDDAYLATKIDNLAIRVSIDDALILSKIDNANCCSALTSLISRDDAYLATKIDTLSTQISIDDALILSKIDNTNCCSALTSLISRDDAYLATKIDNLSTQISIDDALILSKIDNTNCCSALTSLISRDDAYLATKIDNLSTQVSVNDALILSALDNLSVSVPDSCCSALENLISRDDAYLATKIDNLSTQVSIDDALILSKIDNTNCCSALTSLISRDDAYLATKIDNLSTQVSIDDALILSKLDNLSVSFPDSCCSVLENLISRDDAYLATKIDNLSTQISIDDALILSKIDNTNCCSALENLISRDDAYLATKIDNLSTQVSIDDALILSKIDNTNCCSALTSLISQDDAYLATKIDNLSTQVSIDDALILSKLDNLLLSLPDSCCSALENLISRDDAYLATKIDNLSTQISIDDALILSKIDNTNCCSALTSLISRDDAYLATKIDNLSIQISIDDALILSKIDNTNCCSALTSLISRDDAYLATKIDNLSTQISIDDALILSKIDNTNCCSALENLISRDDAYLATKIDNLSTQISIDDALILSKLDDTNCCSVLENLISRDDAYLATKIDDLSTLVSVNDALILSRIDDTNCCSELADLISYDDALILTKLDSLTSCIPITTSTTLSVAGTYCLANDVGNIEIHNTDIIIDLNGHVVTNGITVFSHNITIRNGTVQNPAGDAIQVTGGSNITISHVRAESALNNGINFMGVAGGLVEYCELVQNGTGISLNNTYEVEVYKTIARSSLHSGFSLALSFTNNIHDCQAINSGLGNTNVLNNNVYGFVAQNSFSNIFENCIANATQALSTTDYNSIVAGFALTGTSNCNKIIGCEAANAITNASGVTVPYGIYLQPQFDGLVTVTEVNPAGGTVGDIGRMVSWSPDGIYLAMGGSINTSTGDDVYIYQFNRTSQGLIQVASINPGGGGQEDNVQAVKWSPSGMYLAVAGNMSTTENNLYIYSFDRFNNTVSEVVSLAPVSGSDELFYVSWSSDEQYLAVSGVIGGSNRVYVYKFNSVTQNLTFVTASSSLLNVPEVATWSPDGNYLAVGTRISAQSLQIYSFSRSNGTLTVVDTLDVVGSVYEIQWSPDGEYVAVGGEILNLLIGSLLVYSFDRTTQDLHLVTSINPGSGSTNDTIRALSWSPDGRYLAVGGQVYSAYESEIFVYYFDRGTSMLRQVAQQLGEEVIEYLEWSPDGHYLAATGTITNGNGSDLIILSALTFPSDNVIKDNTVYCNSGAQYPSGVGICGSSICNYIVGNTAYSNPINPPIVSSNYQFVCNVYNQLFELAPSLMQNIALGSCEPIALQDNTALLQKQTLARIGQLSDAGSCLPSIMDVPQDINDMNLNVIQLLKTILLELRGCPCSSSEVPPAA